MPDICMPSLGADMESGTLLEWKVKVGDRVHRGDTVGLVETQKATMEIESFVDGAIEALLVPPDTKVPVGTPLARLASLPAPVPAAVPVPVPAAAPRLRSSPAARRRALQLGIDLSSLHGTGPHGAILLRDVIPPAPTPPPPPPPTPTPTPAPPPAPAP